MTNNKKILRTNIKLPLQKGVALITVLMVVVLAVSISTYLIWIINNRIEIHDMQQQRLQSRIIAQTGIDWAGVILLEDAINTGAIDTLSDIWAQKIPTLPVRIEPNNPDSAVLISGNLVDESAKFNINNLAFSTKETLNYHYESFKKLLVILDIPIVYANYILDWVDNNDEMVDANSAESDYYLKLEPPYRSANQALAEIANITKVREMTPEIINKLRPYITFLPKTTLVNINTASPEVLAAVIPKLLYSDALAIVEERKNNPFKKLSEFVELFPESVRATIPINNLSLGSNFFIFTAQAIQKENIIRTEALLERAGSNWPYVWWQRFY